MAAVVTGEDEPRFQKVLHGERHMRKEPQQKNQAKGTPAWISLRRGSR
jgi:hypothetical protein